MQSGATNNLLALAAAPQILFCADGARLAPTTTPRHPPPAQVETLIRGLCGTSAVRAEIITSWMGLAHVRDTPVGDVMTRGVSGGERKRCAPPV
jgi:hypothetical protein